MPNEGLARVPEKLDRIEEQASLSFHRRVRERISKDCGEQDPDRFLKFLTQQVTCRLESSTRSDLEIELSCFAWLARICTPVETSAQTALVATPIQQR